MTDTFSKYQRQICMSHNKGKDTNPELLIRKTIYSLGYRYRLHRRDLPGCPDIVFFKIRKAIFVNGCFWHRHNCKKGRSMPKIRKNFWQEKFKKTVERDKKNIRLLKNNGWKVLVIWECQIKKTEKLIKRIISFLENKNLRNQRLKNP